ncbi:MAG TPA: GNAT family N-acetyltransferase [Rhodopila sp.]|jgi:RimJ/RimL family protein N-acetyltransferase
MDIPTLTTDRLVLRGLRASDWDDYAAMNADPEVRRWLSGTLLNREQAWEQMATFLGQWALRGYGVFAVESEGRFAGRVGLLHFADWPEPELSWTLASPFWGLGLATEATRAVRRWAFEALHCDRLVSYIRSENVRSRRVAEKLGAVCDGQIVLRNVAADVWVHPPPGHGVVV